MTDHPLTGTAGALQALERTRKENREAMKRLAQPMTHPLTDEDCKQIQLHIFNQTDEDCLRAAYDLGESKGRADMLSEVVEWCIYSAFEDDDDLHVQWKAIDALKKAMRSQEDNQ